MADTNANRSYIHELKMRRTSGNGANRLSSFQKGFNNTVRIDWLRISLGIIATALVIWLALDQSPKARRIRALNRALATHAVGRIDEARQQRMRATVIEMLRALGIPIDVAVDQPFQPGKLNIYSTSVTAEKVTNCGPGNALYDPDIDAIFIDQQFFSVDGYKRIYEASAYSSVVSFSDDLVFPEVFLRFVILHELGHRQLHRKIKGYHPHVSELGSEELRKLEREADQFAVAGIEKFYTFDKSQGGKLVGEPLRDVVGLSNAFNADIGLDEQVHIDLVATLFLMANENLYLDTPYSPFFESKSHPTFLDRAEGAIEALLGSRSLDRKLRANFLFLRESLAREASVGQHAFVEVLVPEPINDVSYGPQGPLILGLGNDHLFEVRGNDISLQDGTHGHPVLRAEPIGDPYKPIGTEPNKGFWTRRDGTALTVDQDGNSWIYLNGKRRPFDLPLPAGLTTNQCFSLLTPPQPTDVALAVACDKTFVHWFTSIQGNNRVASRSQMDIIRDITKRLGRPVDDIEPAALDEQGIFFALVSKGDGKPHLVGSVKLGMSSLAIQEVMLFQGETSFFERDTGSDQVWPLLIAREEGKEKNLLLHGRDLGGPTITAWELSSTHPPKPVSDQKLLVSQVPEDVTPDLIANFDPFVAKIWLFGPTKSLIYLVNDSLYLFDSSQAKFDIVFHPTFEGMDVRLGQNGQWAVFMRGGSRVFFFNTSPGR